jgi:hypothetical protein
MEITVYKEGEKVLRIKGKGDIKMKLTNFVGTIFSGDIRSMSDVNDCNGLTGVLL